MALELEVFLRLLNLKYFSGKFGRIQAKFLRIAKNFPGPRPMDKTIDISDGGQFNLYCRFAHEETRPFRVLLVLCNS